MESTYIRRIRERIKSYDEALKATDPRFNRSVTILHEEGSLMHYECSFVESIDDYYVIFTEHHGTHIYNKNDAKVIQHEKRIPIEEFKG